MPPQPECASFGPAITSTQSADFRRRWSDPPEPRYPGRTGDRSRRCSLGLPVIVDAASLTSARSRTDAEQIATSIRVARIHRPGIQRTDGALTRENGQLARPREQTFEPELEVDELLRAVVGVERLLAVPLAHQQEPAGVSQG